MVKTRFHMVVSYDRSILWQLNTTYWDYIVFASCDKQIEEALIFKSLKRGLRKKGCAVCSMLLSSGTREVSSRFPETDF